MLAAARRTQAIPAVPGVTALAAAPTALARAARSMVEVLAISAVSCILAGTLVLQAHCHSKERRDLLNRIMARDYSEYEAMGGKPPPKSANFIKRSRARAMQQEQAARQERAERAGNGGD